MGNRVIDLTDKELVELLNRNMNQQLDPLEKRMDKIEEALALQAPSFDRKTAAQYCGNKSVGFIDNAFRNHNLPKVKAGGKSTRILRIHLDHFLTGGEFTDDGEMIPNPNKVSQNTPITRAELKKLGS